jgi:hypothetical protein
MPKFYCEYCGVYLTHSSPSGRRQHAEGRKHIQNKIDYYTQLLFEAQKDKAHRDAVEARMAEVRNKQLMRQTANALKGRLISSGATDQHPWDQPGKHRSAQRFGESSTGRTVPGDPRTRGKVPSKNRGVSGKGCPVISSIHSGNSARRVNMATASPTSSF